jgi:hypothetical protein
MPRDPRSGLRARHRTFPRAELLEGRSLLSAISFPIQSLNPSQKETLSVQVPSTYISQQATTLDVTLVRSVASKRIPVRGSLSLTLSAASIAPPANAHTPAQSTNELTPETESVTFQDGQATQTVAVPLVPGSETPLPASVPILLTVTPQSRAGHGGKLTIYLVSGPDAVPPMITGVHVVRKGKVGAGIAVTFSKPMAPGTVTNIHNYKLTHKLSLSQYDNLLQVTNPLLSPVPNSTLPTVFDTLPKRTRRIALKAARYNAATETVTLIPRNPLPSSGSYTIANPSSLLAKRARHNKAQPLTDVDGNALDGTTAATAGSFAITIRPEHPYQAPAPTISNGS